MYSSTEVESILIKAPAKYIKPFNGQTGTDTNAISPATSTDHLTELRSCGTFTFYLIDAEHTNTEILKEIGQLQAEYEYYVARAQQTGAP